MKKIPLNKGTKDPIDIYDVVMSNLCIYGACKTIKEFNTALSKIASLRNPAGKLTMYIISATSTANVGGNYSYGVHCDSLKYPN